MEGCKIFNSFNFEYGGNLFTSLTDSSLEQIIELNNTRNLRRMVIKIKHNNIFIIQHLNFYFSLKQSYSSCFFLIILIYEYFV